MIVPLFMPILGVLAVMRLANAAAVIPIIGIQSGKNTQTGELPIRRDINSLYKERGPQWDLYVSALISMQDANETDPSSYFQVAGIHGQPYIAWSGGGPQIGPDVGYCPHNQELFGTWHRGYLSLFEQILVQHAKLIAASYPEPHRKKYVEAAEVLRIAYWDWAADARVPPVTAMPTVAINKTVAGKVESRQVRNPFYRFQYPESATRGKFGSFDGTNYTKRCIEDGESYPATANDRLADSDLKEKVYNVFVKASSFDEMISTQSQGASFEGPHGEVHVDATCGQDFAFITTAGFEPLFMLHHANVDRLIALWQALHFENATMHFSYAADESFATPAGTIITPDSPIWPFIGSRGVPLNSKSVANVRDWGYTYEPMRFWDQSPGEIKMAVSRSVNSLYGPMGQQNGKKRRLGRREGTSETKYFARMEVERGELQLPCRVHLFLHNKTLGSFTLLDMPKRGMSYDEIPLGNRLEDAHAGDISARAQLSANEQLESLEERLEVVIRKMDGTTIPLGNVPSLMIEVECVDVIPPESLDEMPTLGSASIRAVKTRPLHSKEPYKR